MNVNISIAAFGGAFVEFLEIAVIAYAIARSGYPKEAFWGSIVGVLAIASISIPFSQVLEAIPLHFLEIAIGSILVVFGLRWVQKSVLRQASKTRAGWMSENPLESEHIVLDDRTSNFNLLNFWIVTKSSMLEALEVAILIVTLGLASQAWYEATIGAIVALVFSIVLVAILHQYLLNVPEVSIKMGAGILLSALGTFWLGEGLNIEWILGDSIVVVIVGIYSAIAIATIQWLKSRNLQAPESTLD
ncbi:MAG: hypothetical protein J7641_03935 [Cyanobacteria bacterium SID2]|nr:hypothetical protein [Cyanobacteria bacterium SID2]MBP0002783.1 hypothetical protein [Cyanobacteria bacterium SBC]